MSGRIFRLCGHRSFFSGEIMGIFPVDPRGLPIEWPLFRRNIRYYAPFFLCDVRFTCASPLYRACYVGFSCGLASLRLCIASVYPLYRLCIACVSPALRQRSASDTPGCLPRPHFRGEITARFIGKFALIAAGWPLPTSDILH